MSWFNKGTTCGLALLCLLTKKRAICTGLGGGRELLLNQTIVSDVARLNLDFLLCDASLHIPLLLGDVPDGTSAGTGTRGRENRHAQDTNIIFITD